MKLIRARIRTEVAAAGDRTENPHGFWEWRSTVGAIWEVLEDLPNRVRIVPESCQKECDRETL